MLTDMDKKPEKLKIIFHRVFNPLRAPSIETGCTEELFPLKSTLDRVAVST